MAFKLGKKLRRTDPPVRLPNATAFAKHKLVSPLLVIGLIRSEPAFFEPLLEGTTVPHKGGRPRQEGHWALMYLHFVASKQHCYESWYYATPEHIWKTLGGFDSKPARQTMWDRFIELEGMEDAFLDAAAAMVAQAQKQSGGLFGRDVHVDSTECQAHARLKHDCKPGEGCKHPKWAGCDVRLSAKESTDGAQERRRNAVAALEAEGTEEDEIAPALGDRVDSVAQSVADKSVRIRTSKHGCWWRVLDPDAAGRAYTKWAGGKKTTVAWWLGYYNQKITDHLTGACFAVQVDSANRAEHHIYRDLLPKMMRLLGGKAPRAVVADKGFCTNRVYRDHTELGIATVIPRRDDPTGKIYADTARYDRHGIPRCQHCNGEARFVRFATANPKPRIWFRCTTPTKPGCKKDQSIYCEEHWRLLIPLFRNTEAYLALRNSHAHYENVHTFWRERYRVAGDSYANRLRRRGRGAQQLRASAAVLLEMVRVLYLQQWLPCQVSAINKGKIALIKLGWKVDDAKATLVSFLQARNKLGLSQPYTTPYLEQLALGPP